MINFLSRKDIYFAAIVGESIAFLALPILRNVGVLEFFSTRGILWIAITVWALILPIGAVIGLCLADLAARRFGKVVSEVARYGLIGLLNTVLAAGIINLLIYLFGIAQGLIFDGFVIFSFTFTLTHSFFWNKFWTFKETYAVLENNGSATMEYVKFFVVTGAVSALIAFLMHILVNEVGAPRSLAPEVWANVAFIMLIPVSFLGNFFGYKLIVFAEKK